LVAVLGRIWFDGPPPPRTTLVLIISCIGALVMLSGDLQQASFWQSSGSSSWVGIALATSSSLLLALYMLSVRRTYKYGISSEATFLLRIDCGSRHIDPD
jgi:drug/metabolite transporter (DMT)-like permease